MQSVLRSAIILVCGVVLGLLLSFAVAPKNPRAQPTSAGSTPTSEPSVDATTTAKQQEPTALSGLSAGERMRRVKDASPVDVDFSKIQVCGHKENGLPIAILGNKPNGRAEPGTRAELELIRHHAKTTPENLESLTQMAFQSEVERRKIMQRMFDHLETAISRMRDESKGIANYAAYEVRDEAVYVVPSGYSKDLDQALAELNAHDAAENETLAKKAQELAR